MRCTGGRRGALGLERIAITSGIPARTAGKPGGGLFKFILASCFWLPAPVISHAAPTSSERRYIDVHMHLAGASWEGGPGERRGFPRPCPASIIAQLPRDLRAKVGRENAARVYGL